MLRRSQLLKEIKMKKLITGLLIAVMTVCATAPAFAAPYKGRGGVMGFIAGCCFGVRAAGDYNEGKELGMRDWIRILPFVAIWDGIEGAQGMTRSDYAEQYGSVFY